MKRMAVLAFLVGTGCVTDYDIGEPLAEDTSFIGVTGPYSSSDECFANSTRDGWDCSFALTLCHSGRATLRTGDVVRKGIYAMHGDVARATIEATVLTLDVATLTELDGPVRGGVRWELDTEGVASRSLDGAGLCD